nr:hypothetical protein [Vibrio sp. 03_296]
MTTPELTSLLTEVLSYEGFNVTEANDGEQGLQALSAEIDLILLDVMTAQSSMALIR